MEKFALVKTLAPYVTEDDVTMGRVKFLRTVAERILDDIDALEQAAEELRKGGKVT